MTENLKARLQTVGIVAGAKTMGPTPAAVALATALTQKDFEDVYYMATVIDGVAEEARLNERRRIFRMGFWELLMEMWRSQKLYKPEPFA